MTPLISREEALRLGELEDQAEIEALVWDPSSQLRKRRERFVPPRPDGAPDTERDRVS